MKIEYVEVPEDAVIVIHDNEGRMVENSDDLIAQLHERYPKNFVVLLAGDDTFETLPVEILKEVLLEIIRHEEAQV